MRTEQIGDCTIYLADCRDVLPTLSKVDAVVTDPPYGLGELTGTISIQRNRNDYAGYDDSEENLAGIIIPAVELALTKSNGRGLVTPGSKCCFLYPRPSVIGGFYQPASVGMCPWGFAGFNPVLFYGKDPRGGRGQSCTMTTLTERASDDRHPCSKPIGAMLWMVEKASLSGQTILDPFMGSGTTGVACVQLGRKFIGIEREPSYFDIACERIRGSVAQGRLFDEPKPKPVQESLLSAS